jgi:hypothetical protein
MNGNRRHVNAGEIFWGFLLIAGGLAILLGRLGIADFGWVLGSFWPLFVVLIGISKLFHQRTVWSGIWMIVLGAWLQAVTLHLFDMTYASSWPLLLIVWGAGIIVRTLVESVRRRDLAAEENHHE